ncbi:hypothetical protein [Brevibacillus reuszeri]|uniref:hypothetical protein n=1 Tax=Brevibacillus reuszeri TaxID=54915 RepID=UPI00289CB200|nr:hypothetical protein [Brevibacillus reuszeri]
MNVYNIHLFTIISLLACLLAMYWTQRNQVASDEEKLGVGKGIVKLLGLWIGIPCFLASAQASYQYGIIGMLGYSVAGILGLLFIFMVNRKIIYQRQPLRYLPLLWVLEDILISVLAGKMILNLIYSINDHLSIAFVTSFLLLMLAVQFGKPNQASFVIVLLAMSATMLLPTLVYLKVSVPTVYSGVKFLATDMLRLDISSSWSLAGALLVRFMTGSLIHPRLGITFHQIKVSKRGLCFCLAPLIWACLPISMGTLSFVSKAEAIWPSFPDQVSVMVVGYFAGQIGIVLLIVTLIIILITAVPQATLGEQKSAVWMRGAIILVAGAISLLFPKLTILDTMLYFALIWAAVAPVVLLISKLGRGGAAIVIIAGLTTGCFYSLTSGVTIGVLVDVLVSVSVAVLLTIPTNWKKRRNSLGPTFGSD